jgi:soluble lytic murein transglycosylase-like protein
VFNNEDTYNAIVFQAAAYYGVDAALILATIAQESSFNPNATRYESALGESSMGLMQVLQSTAAGMGWPSDDTLLDPSVNIFAGTEYLAYLGGRYGSMQDVISSYNQGSPVRNPDGTYKNQTYVDKVSAYYNYFKKKFKAEVQGQKNRYHRISPESGLASAPESPSAG